MKNVRIFHYSVISNQFSIRPAEESVSFREVLLVKKNSIFSE
jgi:hypothetical protein